MEMLYMHFRIAQLLQLKWYLEEIIPNGPSPMKEEYGLQVAVLARPLDRMSA
jgi:hypothetical protein